MGAAREKLQEGKGARAQGREARGKSYMYGYTLEVFQAGDGANDAGDSGDVSIVK